MKLIALTGGIASGKSTIAARLAELGAHHIDADQLARDVVAPGEHALDQIVEEFGREVLSDDGTLNRTKLGSIVFDDSELLQKLTNIVHPAVRQRGQELVAGFRHSDPDGIVVYDVPLMVESPNEFPWDLVVVAEAPEETRIDRMVELRGMTRQAAEARLVHQATNEERRAIADLLIDTSGTLEWTLDQSDRLWQSLKRKP